MAAETERVLPGLQRHFPGAQILRVEGVGWNPTDHLHADIRVDGQTMSLFLKRMRTESSSAEIHAYTTLLPRLDLCVPHCHGLFPDPESDRTWLILERAPHVPIDLGQNTHLGGVMAALGTLHGAGRAVGPMAAESSPDDGRTAGQAAGYWTRVLEANTDTLPLDTHDFTLLATVQTSLRNTASTWTHGDLDLSNLLWVEESVCLIDWESSGWGRRPGISAGWRPTCRMVCPTSTSARTARPTRRPAARA